MKKKILVLDNFEFTKKILKQKLKNYELLFKKFKSQKEFENYFLTKKFYAIYCIFGLKISKKIYNSAIKNLRFIISPTTGIDHIDAIFLKDKRIKIIHLKNEIKFLNNITSTAETTWALLLCLSRNIIKYSHDVSYKKIWNRNSYIGNDLKSNTLGIIGYGRIGKMIARYAKAFGMNINVFEIDKKKHTKTKHINFVNLEKVLKCKYITIHIPLDKNKNFFTKKIISKIKKDSILINTSRGDIFDKKIMINLLKKNYKLGLDVLPGDVIWGKKVPKEFGFIKNLKNTIITPHIGGNTYEARIKTTNFIINKFLKVEKKINFT